MSLSKQTKKKIPQRSTSIPSNFCVLSYRDIIARSRNGSISVGVESKICRFACYNTTKKINFGGQGGCLENFIIMDLT